MSEALVIRGCDLLEQAGAPVREQVDLTIRDGRIESIGAADAALEPHGAQVLDGAGLVAMPGLVNAHTHSPENALRGVGEALALEPWLVTMFAAGGAYEPEDHYACALAGALEMLRNGTTAVVDHLWMTPPSLEAIDATMRAYRDAGIRAAVAPLMDDEDWTEQLAAQVGFHVEGRLFPRERRPLPPAEQAALLEDAVVRWHGAEAGRLRVLAGPAGVQWCSEKLLTALAEVADRHGSGMHVHLLETRLQDLACRAHFAESAVAALDSLGILGLCSLAHSVWVDVDGIERIARARAVVVHNPAANARLGSGRAPVRALLDAGVTVALGTDGSASSDNQVLWDCLKLAALLHNSAGEWVTTTDALRMATAGGAAVFGQSGELGRLEAGALADVVLVDRLGDGLAGAQDVGAGLVLSETGRGVRHVIVAGELVVCDGRCVRVDELSAREALRETAVSRHWSADSLAPATHAAIAQVERLRQRLEPHVEAALLTGGKAL